MSAPMKVLHWLFPAGHFVISVLFLLAGLALVAIAGVQLWQGIHLFREASIIERLNSVLESIAVLTVAVAALELVSWWCSSSPCPSKPWCSCSA